MSNRFGLTDSLLNAVKQTMQNDTGVSKYAAFGRIEEAAQPKWKVAIGNKHYTVTARNTAEASRKAQAMANKEGNRGVGGQITKMAEQKMDPVNKKALEKDFDDREDKDIDNDGDVDKSDEYLHNRRKAVKQAMKKEESVNEADKDDDRDELTKKLFPKRSRADMEKSDRERNRKMNQKRFMKPGKPSRSREWGAYEGVNATESFDLSDYTVEELEDFMMSEEFNQLDELSKKTLGSYIKKAKTDVAGQAYQLGAKDPLKPKASWSKALGRAKHIDKAVDRLTKEEAEDLGEDISKMSHGRLKWHMNTGTPHGSYSNAEMKAERDRRMKYRDSADAYKKAKPGLSEQSKEYGPGHIGAIQKMLDKEREAKKAKTLTNSKKDTIEMNPKDTDDNKGER